MHARNASISLQLLYQMAGHALQPVEKYDTPATVTRMNKYKFLAEIRMCAGTKQPLNLRHVVCF
jgi:hypothetical protein